MVLDQAFFGLEPSDLEKVFLEPFFLLGYYFGISWETYLRFPVVYKRWLIQRINEEIEKAQKAQADIPHKGPHMNDPQVRRLTAKFRTIGTRSPKKHRFT